MLSTKNCSQLNTAVEHGAFFARGIDWIHDGGRNGQNDAEKHRRFIGVTKQRIPWYQAVRVHLPAVW